VNLADAVSATRVPSRLRRNNMYKTVAAFPEELDEAGQHRGRLLSGIMKQDDSAPTGLEPALDQVKLLLMRAHIRA
jgi:hypothetical protein